MVKKENNTNIGYLTGRMSFRMKVLISIKVTNPASGLSLYLVRILLGLKNNKIALKLYLMIIEIRIHLRVNLSFQSCILFTLANTNGMVRGVIRAIDLFSGAGGLSLGFELAGVEILAAVEHCDKAVTTYKRNFPNILLIVLILRN